MWRALIVSLALICLVLLGWYAIKKYPGRIEADLASRAQTALAARVPGVTVMASQRDLVLSGRVETEEDRARAQAFVLEVSGVKSVVNQLQVGTATPEPSPEPVPAPDTSADTTQADTAQPDTEQPDTQPALVDAGPVDVADTAAEVVDAAIADTAVLDVAAPDAATAAPDTAKAAPAGALTAAQCKETIATMLEGDKRIMFHSNTGKLTDDGQKRLSEVWAVLSRCPEAKGTIEAYHDDYGDPDKVKTLTQIRAYNTHKRLVDMGMDEKRFRYMGLGYRNMRYRKPGERLLNQRIEFNITVE